MSLSLSRTFRSNRRVRHLLDRVWDQRNRNEYHLKELETYEIFLKYFEIIIVVTTCLVVLITNSAYEDIKYTGLAIVVTIGSILIIQFNPLNEKENFKSFAFSLLFGVFFVFQFIIGIQGSKKGKNSQRKLFYNFREHLLFEYTY